MENSDADVMTCAINLALHQRVTATVNLQLSSYVLPQGLSYVAVGFPCLVRRPRLEPWDNSTFSMS
jgi:hypothetical protein